MVPLIIFLILMAIFGVIDYSYWIEGKETMSEWLVNKAMNSKVWAWVILAIILITCLVLIVHFELIEALSLPTPR